MSDPARLLQPALAAYRRGDLGEAERLCRDALTADPRAFDAHHLLVVIQARAGRAAEALASCDKALTLRPNDAQLLANRAVVLDALGRSEEAVASCDRALAREPNSAPTLSNRGNSLRALGRFDEALASYDRALALQPDFADCRFNRALLLLLRGRFADGWREYEWRRRLASWPARQFGGAEWRGEDLRGRRLLLYAEQGVGETIQFARFVPLLAERGGEIVLEVPSPLAGLLQTLTGAAQIVRRGETLPEVDLHLPLASVPLVLGLDPAQIPAAAPYLRADPARVAAWAERLPEGEFRVGLAWQDEQQPTRQPGERGRGLTLAALAPLGRVAGVRLVSLQKHAGADPLADRPAGLSVADPGPDFEAGPDTLVDAAAVMVQLDLVIAADGAIAHLAGALGRPAWLLLPDVPDWRWLLERPDSPWYPTARLFRQSRRGDWDEPVGRVAGALAALIAKRQPRPATPPRRDAAAGGSPLPAFVISLARRPDRRSRFLGWNAGKGIDIAVFDAVDGQTLNKADLRRADLIDDEDINFTPGFLGSALSHRALWQKCSELGRPILIFEDDVFLPDRLRDWLEPVMDRLADGWDIVHLGYNRDAILSIGAGGGGAWCNLAFQTPRIAFEREAELHDRAVGPLAHCLLETRLVWGITAYAVSPQGARALLRHCFPLSNRQLVRMYGSGRMLVPYGIDGMVNLALQRGLVRAQVVFPPLVIGPNDQADSDNYARPG